MACKARYTHRGNLDIQLLSLEHKETDAQVLLELQRVLQINNSFIYSNSKMLLLWLFLEGNPTGLLYLQVRAGNISQSTLDQMQTNYSKTCESTSRVLSQSIRNMPLMLK